MYGSDWSSYPNSPSVTGTALFASGFAQTGMSASKAVDRELLDSMLRDLGLSRSISGRPGRREHWMFEWITTESARTSVRLEMLGIGKGIELSCRWRWRSMRGTLMYEWSR